MTEAEWLTADLSNLYAHVRRSARRTGLPHRKFRLFGCACCRLIWSRLSDERSRQVIETAERFADGGAKKSELARADRAAAEVAVALKLPREPKGLIAKGKHPPQLAAEMAVWAGHESIQDVVEMTSMTAECLVKVLGKPPHSIGGRNPQAESLRRLDAVLREIFGNPFRPVTFSPSWRTDTVRALAAQMYESRDFGAMPILADALQDAGCDRAAVLDHCRGDGPHVRGCWVVDLVLEKE